MSSVRKSILAVAMYIAMASPSHAAFITYNISGTGSGTLGSTVFNGAAFTITATADTSQVTSPLANVFAVTDISASITIANLGPASFSSTMIVDNQSSSIAGISTTASGTPPLAAILGVSNAAFATYDLKTSIGPLSGTPVFNSGFVYSTSQGNLTFNSITSASFQATLGTVPEPSSIALCGIAGFAGLGIAGVRRLRAA